MSKPAHPTKSNRRPGRALIRLHRRVGLALSGIFIVICVTGILLNHSDDLDFQSRPIESDWVYDWYGLKPAGDLLHFPLSHDSVSSLDGQLYLGEKSLGPFPAPVGVAELETLKAIAFARSILLITPAGDIIETLPDDAIPGTQISQIGSADQRTLIIDTDLGAYLSDETILEWTRLPAAPPISTVSSSAAPEELAKKLLRSFRGEGITWGRVLLDIHTGRFFGSAGKWIADLSGIALILLTLTGVYYSMRFLKRAR